MQVVVEKKRLPKAVRWGAVDRNFMKPTVERMHQNDGIRKNLIQEDPRSRAVTPRYRARAECVLDSYLIRGNITDEQHAAGVKFREAYQRAALRVQTRNVLMIVVDQGKGSADGLQDSRARELYKQAMSVLTLAHKAVVIDVCGHDQTAGGTRKLNILVDALQKLSDVWHTKKDDDFLS